MRAGLNRRRALQTGAASGLLLGAASNAIAARDEDALDIIDCHTHFYDPSRPQGVPWPRQGTSLYRTVLPHHLRQLPKAYRVTGTVIVEASHWVEDNAWLLRLAKDDPFIVGVVGNLTPGGEGFVTQLNRFARNELFRGIRISYRLLERLLDEGNLRDLELLRDRDLQLDVNGGPATPSIVARLAQQIPALRIVVNHVGNVRIDKKTPPQPWGDGIRAASDHENVYCKVSALVEGASRGGQPVPAELDFYRPYIDVVWQAFGDDRVIYGSNWPVSDRATDYATLQRIVMQYAGERGEEATRKFCSLNAKRAYKWLERDGRLEN